MKILNFGSLNVDYVYKVDHITMAGETQSSSCMQVFAGGKGLNQSIAMAKAGIKVHHAGIIGEDGDILVRMCQDNNIDISYLKTVDHKSGHTIIQVDKNGQNCILLSSGSNGMIDEEYVDKVLDNFEEGDIIILQNEINMLDYIIRKAFEKSMTIVLNPSPYNDIIMNCDLSKVSIFIMNEIEGKSISGGKDKPEEILDVMLEKYPNSTVVLTLGEDGAYYSSKDGRYYQPIFTAEAVDTTAAGDTFTGYFIRGYINDSSIQESLRLAACAASITVSREGAAGSIPFYNEVNNLLV